MIRRTADRHADIPAKLVEDGEVDVRRQVSSIELRGEGRVHVVRDVVNVQLVTERYNELVNTIRNEAAYLPMAMRSYGSSNKNLLLCAPS